MSTTLDWYGCATFRLRTAGCTVLLDAYIDRAPNAAGTGLTADDIVECDWIVIGHSHFDHLWGAAPGHSDRGDGGALMYLFETREGSLLFQDTSGHWGSILETLTPDVAILAAAGRANIDGDPVQGSLAAFVAAEAKALGVRRVVLAHHDNWLPGFSSAPDLEPIRAAFEAGAPDAELLEPGYLAATPIFERHPAS